MTNDTMGELLSQRLSEEGMAAEIPISIAELHRRLLPYPLCRDRLGFASKSEYDIGFLQLLIDDRTLHVPEVALIEATRKELSSPEPGLALLQRFAASEVRLRSLPETGSADMGMETGPPIADLETGRSRGDHLPGLDDPLLVPQDESADALGRKPSETVTARLAEGGDVRSTQDCRSCRAPLPPRAGLKYCPGCGADQERWPCPSCGEEVERGWSYCALCGKMLAT